MAAKKRGDANMAARRISLRTRLTPRERRELKQLKKVSREARADVKRLLKRARAGTLGSKQLQSGLADVEMDLTLATGFHFFKL